MKTLRAGVLLSIALAACGGNGTGDSGAPVGAPTPDARYGTVEALKEAAVAAGYECKHWKQTNVVETAAQSGECGRDSVFATFASAGDLQEQLRLYRGIDKLLGNPDPRLVGPNWIINSPDAPDLQPALGGTVENG